jgi:hypothetical protein
MPECQSCGSYSAEWNSYFDASVCNGGCGYALQYKQSEARKEKENKQKLYDEDDTYAETNLKGVWLVHELLEENGNIIDTNVCVGRRSRNGAIERIKKAGHVSKVEWENISRDRSDEPLYFDIEVKYTVENYDYDTGETTHTEKIKKTEVLKDDVIFNENGELDQKQFENQYEKLINTCNKKREYGSIYEYRYNDPDRDARGKIISVTIIKDATK